MDSQKVPKLLLLMGCLKVMDWRGVGELKDIWVGKKKSEVFFSSYLGANWSTVSITVC